MVRLKALKYMTGETGGVFQLAKMVDPSVIGSFVRMIASIIGRIAMALKEPSTMRKLLTFEPRIYTHAMTAATTRESPTKQE